MVNVFGYLNMKLDILFDGKTLSDLRLRRFASTFETDTCTWV